MEYIKWINEQYPFILLSYHPFFALSFIGVFRLMVSASQDGKLLIWDSHSGNKVRLTLNTLSREDQESYTNIFKL